MKKFRAQTKKYGLVEYQEESLEKAQAHFPGEEVWEVLGFWDWIKKYAKFEIR
jgi:hypothetical protein